MSLAMTSQADIAQWAVGAARTYTEHNPTAQHRKLQNRKINHFGIALPDCAGFDDLCYY